MGRSIFRTLICFCATAGFVACSNQDFSSGKGEGVANSSKGGPVNSSGRSPNESGGGVTDDGTVSLVDAELQIDRLPDMSVFQNCLFAHLVDQPITELGCNRYAPKQDNPRPPLMQNIKLKLKTYECNQIRVYFKTNSGQGLFTNVTTATNDRIFSGASKHNTGTKGPGINIIREASGSILIEANDNNDTKWHDVYLRITPPPGKPNLKFTIENSGIPCS
jgi:hypothetical protein